MMAWTMPLTPDQGGTAITPVDTDSDGTPDYLDTDADNDNLTRPD